MLQNLPIVRRKGEEPFFRHRRVEEFAGITLEKDRPFRSAGCVEKSATGKNFSLLAVTGED